VFSNYFVAYFIALDAFTYMKSIVSFLFIYFWALNIQAQTDYAKIYQTHDFPCDTAYTTIDITFCVGDKYEFADSLLNHQYQSILLDIKKEIAGNLKRLKETTDKQEIEFLLKANDYLQRRRSAIIVSQRNWIKLRDANVDVVAIGCEGGTACNAIRILSEIDDILERIKKLQSF
jgi:uncharacterized protein YecT (DUF1311 family)